MNLVALLKYMQENYGEQRTNYPMAGNEVAKKFKQGVKAAFETTFLGDDYEISASIGTGGWANVPWIAVHDKEISTSVQEGVNIVYLFTNDYQGVYLSLNQGYTYVNKNYKNAKLSLVKIARFWQENLSTLKSENSFTIDPIILGREESRYTNLVKGYESCNIYSKYYDIKDLGETDNDLLLQDLLQMLTVFKELKGHLMLDDKKGIEATIDFIINNGTFNELSEKTKSKKVFEIEKKRKLVLGEEETHSRNAVIKEEKAPYITKRDYAKEAIRNTEKELQGEYLVINYERDRLMKNTITKSYADKITHVAESGDGHGYDIISYDINPDAPNEVIEIYIEVKTTTGNRDAPFYLSDNELNVARTKGKRYKIYRVYNYNTMPQLKIINNLFNENLEIKPINYIVKGVNQNDSNTKKQLPKNTF
ncbi:TPA: MrcB family domain-containing protein [Listeria innocua]